MVYHYYSAALNPTFTLLEKSQNLLLEDNQTLQSKKLVLLGFSTLNTIPFYLSSKYTGHK